ncbi:MAG: pilus assembly PilX N-terminal domain-containing protein [Tissierellaceae bacterium]|nr:pilus assembly PilX N-terminal domain-containing protein [Tissierellaceae bacterium]
MKKRKGSTLVLTLMVFAVLMIFATFTLSFMVTENKQSLYHQHKTQAYYIARSGAEAVEAAILGLFEDEDPNDRDALLNKIEVNPVNVLEKNDESLKLSVKIWKEDISSNKINIIINSNANINSASEKIIKVLPIDVTNEEDKLISFGDKPIISIESASQNLIDKGWVEIVGEVGKSKYPGYTFTYSSYELAKEKIVEGSEHIIKNSLPISNDVTWGSEGKDTVYFIDGDVTINSKDININVKGKVDIYVNGTFSIKENVYINKDGVNDNLNIYVYNSDNDEYSIEVGRGKKIDFIMYGNFFVNSGIAHFDGHKVTYRGNIISNGDKVYFKSQDNSGNHHVYTGLIYAPNSDIYLDVQSESAYSFNGYVVGNDITHHDNLSKKTGFKKDIPGGGVTIPPIYIEGKPIFSNNNPGYYR